MYDMEPGGVRSRSSGNSILPLMPSLVEEDGGGRD